MKILDWRPRGERLLMSWWQRRQNPSEGPGRGQKMWGALHQRAVDRRVAARQIPATKPLIISVGNLSLGGTGKTPVVIQLALDLATRGRCGCVLTRGYKSPLKGPLFVQAEHERAGDEARLLADSLAETAWTVVQSRSRLAGLQFILAQEKLPELVILEDGHQTARVGRHLDLLILDSWQLSAGSPVEVVPTTGPVFPGGPWRESATGARRASIWLLETAADMPSQGTGGSSVLTFERRFSLAMANLAAEAEDIPRTPLLVSGIARPEKFEAGALDLLASSAPVAIRLADHSAYDVKLVEKMQWVMQEAGCQSLVTTSKDWVKLAPLWPDDVPAYTVGLAIRWGQDEALVDLIDKRL